MEPGVDDDSDGDVDEGSTKASVLIGSGVTGISLAHAPGLKKGFNLKSKAALRAGKKK